IAVLTIARAGEDKIYAEMDKYGANLMITPAINDIGLSIGNLDLGNLSVGENYIDEMSLPRIRKITDGAIRGELGDSLGIPEGEDIATIAPKLYINTNIGSTSIVAVGFDPSAERFIKTWWTVEGEFPEQQDEAIIGQTASEVLGLNWGDNVVIGGQEVKVVGIIGLTGSDDDYQVFLPLQTAQRIFDKEGLVSSVDIRALCNGCPVEVIADSINGNITGVRAVAIKQIANNEMNLMGKMNDFMMALAGIILLIGTFGVINTMVSSVHERIKDIGIMRAVGASRNQIIKMFLYEAVVVGVIGGIIGYGFGTLLSYLVGPLIFEGVTIAYVMDYLPASLGIAIAIAVIASMYPAFRASQIKVADSIRST
ncbi:MAG: FtsX-like permease family protein, partial [Chloroflexota bacterium]|nr:FtsX-like permease family protein [Chloroflexota bacterium]